MSSAVDPPAPQPTSSRWCRRPSGSGTAVAWSAEAYGSDAATVLGYLAAQTERIDLGAAVLQIPARTPAMTAMTAATLDLLSGGRFRLGLGVSGPQVSEGWHGVRFDKPLARTREYVDVVRTALARQTVTHDGEFFTLPLPDGPGKALKLAVHPAREHVPIYLAAVGPKNLELAGEIADGWLAIFFSPGVRRRGDGADRGRPRRGGRDGRRPLRRGSHRAGLHRPRRRRVRRPDPPVRRPLRRRHGHRGSRTSTTSSPGGWASRTRPRRSRTSTWTGSTARPWRLCRSTSSTRRRCSVRRSGSRSGCTRSPKPA